MLGGTVATNAGGPASFKYGVTREWIHGLRVLLFNGDVLEIERGQTVAEPGGHRPPEVARHHQPYAGGEESGEEHVSRGGARLVPIAAATTRTRSSTTARRRTCSPTESQESSTASEQGRLGPCRWPGRWCCKRVPDG